MCFCWFCYSADAEMKGACVIWLSPTEQMPGHQPKPSVQKKQAWHRRPQQRWCSVGNLATHFKFHTGWTKPTYHVHLKLLAGGVALEDCDARQLLHQPRTEISQHLLAHLSCQDGSVHRARSPEPDLLPLLPELHEPLMLVPCMETQLIVQELLGNFNLMYLK